MKTSYLCSSCHQYHPIKNSKNKAQMAILSTPFIRFSDLFGYQPKPDPKVYTMATDLSQSNQSHKPKNKPINIKVPTIIKPQATFLKHKTINKEKNQNQEIKRDSSIWTTPQPQKYSRKTPIRNTKSKPKFTLQTNETNIGKEILAPKNVSQYIEQEPKSSAQQVMHKPYLISNHHIKAPSSNLDYNKKITELKGLLEKKKEEKNIKKGCEKQYCTIKDNRCCGMQVHDEGQIELTSI